MYLPECLGCIYGYILLLKKNREIQFSGLNRKDLSDFRELLLFLSYPMIMVGVLRDTA